jgi:hypothetical protein
MLAKLNHQRHEEKMLCSTKLRMKVCIRNDLNVNGRVNDRIEEWLAFVTTMDPDIHPPPKHIVTSIRKAWILEAALFTRQRIAFTQRRVWSKAFPLQRMCGTRCCLSSPPRGYLRESPQRGEEFQIRESAREESS